MSYILDALRRADADRERGSVPGIHAQPAGLPDADSEAPRSTRSGLWIGIAFVLLLLAVLGGWLLGHDTPPPAAAPVLAAPAPVSPASTPTPVPPGAALVAALPPAPVPAPPRAAEPARAAPAKAPTPAAASLPAAAEPRVYQLSELPEEIRRELPTLAVGGAMYSQSAANRMLIVNGQTFHEGDKLAPNLLLQQIRLKSAVLEYKGYRYGITY